MRRRGRREEEEQEEEEEEEEWLLISITVYGRLYLTYFRSLTSNAVVPAYAYKLFYV
jgi:hypothetical protein